MIAVQALEKGRWNSRSRLQASTPKWRRSTQDRRRSRRQRERWALASGREPVFFGVFIPSTFLAATCAFEESCPVENPAQSGFSLHFSCFLQDASLCLSTANFLFLQDITWASSPSTLTSLLLVFASWIKAKGLCAEAGREPFPVERC